MKNGFSHVAIVIALCLAASPASAQVDAALAKVRSSFPSLDKAGGKMIVTRTMEVPEHVRAKVSKQDLERLSVGETLKTEYDWVTSESSFLMSYKDGRLSKDSVATQNMLYDGKKFYDYIDFPEHPERLKIGTVSVDPIVRVTPLAFGYSYRFQTIPDALKALEGLRLESESADKVVFKGKDARGRAMTFELDPKMGNLARRIMSERQQDDLTVRETYEILKAKQVNGFWLPTEAQYLGVRTGDQGEVLREVQKIEFRDLKVNDPTLALPSKLPTNVQFKDFKTDALFKTDSEGKMNPVETPKTQKTSAWGMVFVLSAGALMLGCAAFIGRSFRRGGEGS